MKKGKEKKPKKGMARLMELAGTKKPLILAAAFFAAVASVVSFVPYLAIYRVVEELLRVWPQSEALNGEYMIHWGILAVGGAVLQIVLYFIALACSHLAAFGTLYELKLNFATHLARVPLGFHVVIGSGKLRKVMDENIEKVEEFIAHQLPDTVAAMVAPVAMVAILLFVDWRFGLAALLGVVIAFVLQMAFYGNDGAKAMMAEYQNAMEEMNNASVEYIRGISVVKAFRQTVYSFRRLYDTIKAYTAMVIPYTLSWKNPFSAFSTLIHHIYIFLLPVGIWVGMHTTDYKAFATTLIFYLVFTPSIAGVLMKTMYVSSSSMRLIHGVEAMDEILAQAELSQPAEPKTVSHHTVSFHAVSFRYQGEQETQALRGVSFTAKQGEITAIVGPSGSGKSTIAHLIPRFFDVTEGSIRLGDADVREMTTSYLMDQVSFVFQDVFLFKQSVADNIRMGKAEAAQEEIEAACKAAQCHDFIMRLPRGYDTVIGTRGVHLSGGERQRLAIARAIVKDAPVVVLDEATAFADPENEHLIQKAFETLLQGKTVVMIAHRLSTIRSANKIVVMDGGQVVEEGSHDVLLEKEGKYAAMWRTYHETVSWTMERKGAVQ